jgi:hypothetical protein
MQSVNILGKKTNTKGEKNRVAAMKDSKERDKKNVPSLWQLATVDASYDLIA